MQDFLLRLRLDEIHHFILSGNPPISAQLLAVNTVMMIIFIMRRMRGAMPGRHPLTFALQWVLVGCNMLVVMEQDWMPYIDNGQRIFMQQYHHLTQ
jgi:hypothetical protein